VTKRNSLYLCPTQPETTQPETTQPETTQPEITQPETTQPETTRFVTTQSEIMFQIHNFDLTFMWQIII
jgi:hypothetical protein